MKLGIIDTFDAGHFLPDHPRCGRPHGHTYQVELVVEGENRTGMVVDFHDLKITLREILAEFDHVSLNDILSYPSCENLCETLHARLSDRLSFPFHLRVWEGEGKWVEI